jgi:branched-chain amino acid transport system substrate-binding protein
MKVPLVMNSGFLLEFAKLAGPASNGIVFPTYKVMLPDEAIEDRAILEFKRAHKDRFGTAPGTMAAAHYDALTIVGEAVRTVGGDRAKIRDWVEANVKKVNGMLGVFTFGPDDHNGFASESLVMAEVVDDGNAVRLAP